MRPRFVVRPRKWLLALLAAACLGFTASGVMMIASGEVYSILVGLFVVTFFGGGGVLAGRVVARRGLSQLTLTPAGIELTTGGLLPWEDIEAIGTARLFKNKFLGVRLKRYDGYLASVPEVQRTEMERHMRWWLKPMAWAGVLFGGGGLLLSVARDVSSLETALRWSRAQTGWDYTFSPAWLDRPLEDFVDLLERYRRSAASEHSPP